MAPQDGLDMNRVWPGAPIDRAMHLWAHSELVAHAVSEHIHRHATALIDLHDAGWMGLMSPFVTHYPGQTPELDAQIRAMALAAGLDLVWRAETAWIEEKAPGSIRVPMNRAGIPSIEVEFGGEGRVNPLHFGRILRSLKNVMRHLNMMDGAPEVPERYIDVNRSVWMRAPHGGFLFTHVNPLDPVRQDQPLATITDLFGRERHVMRAPRDGHIVGKRTFGTVATGQYVMTVVWGQ
jgi:predicted deacylase